MSFNFSENEVNSNKKDAEDQLKQTTSSTTTKHFRTTKIKTTSQKQTTQAPITFKEEASLVQHKRKQINTLLITFDFINIVDNTLKVQTSEETVNFNIKVYNKTDIFKGIKNGAVYLHSKTNFNLDLKENKNDFCITSEISKEFNKTDIACSNGWTISFWIKIFNKINFDKTIIQIDNASNNKFISFRLSNNRIKIQNLFNQKLWEINQNFSWKSEWTMFTLSWTEFEGLTIYVNDKLFSNEQSFEYYSPFNSKNRFSFNTRREFDYSNIKGHGSSVILIGLNNQVEINSRNVSSKFDENFSESILIDELKINNFRQSAKEISENYLKSNFFIYFLNLLNIILYIFYINFRLLY